MELWDELLRQVLECERDGLPVAQVYIATLIGLLDCVFVRMHVCEYACMDQL